MKTKHEHKHSHFIHMLLIVVSGWWQGSQPLWGASASEARCIAAFRQHLQNRVKNYDEPGKLIMSCKKIGLATVAGAPLKLMFGACCGSLAETEKYVCVYTFSELLLVYLCVCCMPPK